MGVPLNGYRTVCLLRSSGQSRVYEAIRESDGVAVIAKVFELESDDVEPRVEHEFALIEGLDIDGVVKALSLERVGDQLVLLLERVPGQNLAEYTQRQPIDLDRFFSIAIQLSEVINRIHNRRVIHRDIKPTNILIEAETGQVCLADFGISVLLDAERRHLYDPAVLEGTLPYISPEQTGRTGRSVDFRSDLYSLGVTFYELLTGRRPFEFSAPLELIHAHLARTPPPPEALRRELPEGVSRLVMKLLEKPPEHRYQTAAGLAADLRKLRELVELGMDGRELVLGREDFPRNLQLPHQLYGRMQERHELVDELDRVMRAQASRVLLLTGPSGIGKSMLLTDFEGPVSGFGGYLARGKFDAFREIPYAGFVAAFETLVAQLLTESEERLDHWRLRLSKTLGNLGQVMIELIPSLELVIGSQPPLPELRPLQARNRLHLTVGRFLATFCDESLPLVLVLDDLHWADPSSLDLLRSVIEGGRRGALLILGSYREEAIDPWHPLAELIHALVEQHRVRITRLRPLSQEAVEALLADTLARPVAEVRKLAKIIGRKTDNNPLFIRQFLTHLDEHGHLRPGEHGWTWDEETVEAAGIPDDVIEVMTAKLASLSEGPRKLLGQAACVGPRFDLATLEIVSERPRADLAQTLYNLVQTGLLAALGREYSFAHDRIQDAAHEGLGEDERRRLHWMIGRHALEREDEPTHEIEDEHLFELVDHLDAGLIGDTACFTGPLDAAARLELARLNLRAGSRALDAASYEPALRYLEVGVALVHAEREAVAARGEDASHFRLVVDLAFVRAQVLALVNRNEEARASFDELLDWELDIGTYGRVAARRVRLLTLEDKMNEAVEFGVAALARCGFSVRSGPGNLRTLAVLVRAWLAMRRYDTAALMAIPVCTEPRVEAAMELLTAIKNVAYIVDAKLLMLLTGLHIKLFLRYGFHPTCPHALSILAMGVGPGLGRIDDAIKLCEQGLALADRVPETNSRVLVETASYLFVWHLGRPFSEPLARLDSAYERALEGGEFEYAGYMGALGLSMHFDVGTHLRVVERLTRRLERDVGRWGSLEMVLVAWMIRAFAVTLLGKASEDDEFEEPADEFDSQSSDIRDALDPDLLTKRGNSRVSIYAAHINLGLLRLIFSDAQAALDHALQVIDDIEEVLLGSWMVPRVAITAALAGIMRVEEQGSVPPSVHKAIHSSRKLLRRWAQNCPENFGCYSELAEGAYAAMRGRPEQAMRRLERARVDASARSNRMIEGLAAEQLARVAAAEGLHAFADGARLRAWAAYEAWGATAKLRQLRVRFPELFTHRGRSEPEEPSRSRSRSRPAKKRRSPIDYSAARSGTHTNTEFLDFESVLHAVGSMSEELGLEQVITRVLDAALTNAGADRGVLLLERDGLMGIVAEANVSGQHTSYVTPLALSDAGSLCPISLVHFVLRTQQDMVIEDARTDPRFSGDAYIVRTGVQSLLGMPILKGTRLLGALVLENRLSAHCFTPERLEALGLIASQAATALDNANLYHALRRSEARWRSLVDGAPDLIALLNERGEVEFVNRTPLVDDTPGELDGRLFEMFLSSQSADQWREAVAAVLREGVQRELEIQILQDEGPPRWFVARLAPIDAEIEGGVRHAVAIATDITERRLAEREREVLEAQLRQQQRLESIGTLASGVAHEINNPVQGILNYAELIVDNLDSHEIIREFSGEITSEANRVATIVRNLMQFARQEREQRLEATDIPALVEATLSLIQAIMRRDQIQVSVEIADELPEVQCRTQQIQQVLMNLLGNARDALNELYPRYDERKRVTVRVEAFTRRDAPWVRIAVEDAGPGIPPDVLARIFDPFFTTKGRDQSTGLGLSVSHGIAHDHGGELSAESTAGEGARFHLELPCDGL